MPKLILKLILCILLVIPIACKPHNFDADMRAADAFIGIGDNDAALTAYRAMVERYKTHERRPELLIKLADLYQTILGEEELATLTYSKVIDEYPFTEAGVIAREYRAGLNEKRGSFDNAAEDYSNLIKYFPESKKIYDYKLSRIEIYLSQKNVGQAIEELHHMFDKTTPVEYRDRILFVMAESYFLDDKPELAIKYYQELIEDYPKSKLISEAKLHMATCLEELGYLGKAKDITKNAAKEYPNQQVISARMKSIVDRGTKPLDIKVVDEPKDKAKVEGHKKSSVEEMLEKKKDR